MNDLQSLCELDTELVQAAKRIKVLSQIAWKASLQPKFLHGWRQGNPKLPKVGYAPIDLTESLSRLDSIANRASRLAHPLAPFVRDTARSYHDIGQLLEHVGTPEATRLSIEVYGRPGDILTGGKGTSSLDAANFFLSVANEFYRNNSLNESEFYLPAEAVKKSIDAGLTDVFEAGKIDVVIDKNLASKAAAGATRIRLRDATCYSEYDAEQLLQHEAFVHSLTALNGRAQPNLKSMSLGAPRTTAAQEGLATFAELVTGAIDIARLDRIAMRIIAIDMALGGADFIDVFRYFDESGQLETESYNSTMRVFRGVPVEGGHAFTKDAVYLRGLLEVHTFFRWAFREQRLTLCRQFFAGRMTLSDVVRYSGSFTDGTLCQPRYLPPWMTRTTGLAGYLAFSVFADSIDLSKVYAGHNFDDIVRSNEHAT